MRLLIIIVILHSFNYYKNDLRVNDNSLNHFKDNLYYDENYNELRMNTSEYYDYLYNNYVKFNNTIYSDKNDFMENIDNYFEMKNKNIDNFTYETLFIPITEKDYKNHHNYFNENDEINYNRLNNYYIYMCNTHPHLCGLFENNNKYYYPYFNAYNINIFKYIFKKIYKTYVNFDIEYMINNVPNINEMTQNILVKF